MNCEFDEIFHLLRNYYEMVCMIHDWPLATRWR